MINSQEKSIVDVLYELSNFEITAKQDRSKIACVKVVNFPFVKTLNDFDFTFQPGINKQEILDLATLRFIEKN